MPNSIGYCDRLTIFEKGTIIETINEIKIR